LLPSSSLFGSLSVAFAFSWAALCASQVHIQNTMKAVELTTIVSRRRLCRQFLRSATFEYNAFGFSYITSTVLRGRMGRIGASEAADLPTGDDVEFVGGGGGGAEDGRLKFDFFDFSRIWMAKGVGRRMQWVCTRIDGWRALCIRFDTVARECCRPFSRKWRRTWAMSLSPSS
jgi:hypothetical protein